MTVEFLTLADLFLYRIVICLAISVLADEPAPPAPAPGPVFFSKIFQNFRLSSAAALVRRGQLPCLSRVSGPTCGRRHSPVVASICPSGLRQL